MDDASLLQVRSLWPDVADPFSRVIPDGCDLIHAVDDWSAGGLRKRLIDLARGARGPELEALFEEACEDAERRGWTPVDDETTDEEKVYELEGVHLHLSMAGVHAAGVELAVLRAWFDQPWPKDAGAPVDTSEMFQNLVRKLLKLGGSPERLKKELIVDRSDLFRMDQLHEEVHLPRLRDVSRDLFKLEFKIDPATEVWTANTISETYGVTARYREVETVAIVEMVKKRLAVAGA